MREKIRPNIKVRKKGKTRGRPSKEERLAQVLINHHLTKHEQELRDYIFDIICFGYEKAPRWKGKAKGIKS